MSHAAKQLALEAYASALLSKRATSYLERHLETCAVCSAALAKVRVYSQLRAEARDESVVMPSWERLEAALAGESARSDSSLARPARKAHNGKLIALAWPLLAIAAALAITWLGRSGQQGTEKAPTAQRAAPSPAPAARLLEGWVSLVAGSATLERGALQNAITLDSKLHEGDVLVTGPEARLDVQLGAATGFALGTNTRLRIAKLRAGETLLELAVGRVANQVEKLDQREQYQVLAADLTASVRGTRFWVERSADVAVFVHEGRVEVARGSELLATLTPGQGYPQPRFAAAQAKVQDALHLPLRALSATVGLVLPPLPSLRAFIVDGAAISAAGTLAMRLPPGPTELKFEDRRGQIHSVRVDLNAPLTTLEPAALAELIAPKPGPVGYLSPEQISPVVRSAIEPLRRCYERNLRIEPKLESKFVVRMRVSAEGRVVRSEIDAQAKLPLDLERCIELETQKLRFPKPEGGGPVSFEVPLNLKSSR